MINLITISKKKCRLGRSLQICGTIHYSLTCLEWSPKGLSQTDHYRQVTTISRFSKFSICVTNMFDNRPISFHSLHDRQNKIRLHAVHDTTTAKIYKRIYLHCYKQWYICTTNILNQMQLNVFFLGCFLSQTLTAHQLSSNCGLYLCSSNTQTFCFTSGTVTAF